MTSTSVAQHCHTCNIFTNDQSFKSTLTGKEYKIISYDRLSLAPQMLSVGYIVFNVVLFMYVKLEDH